MNATQYLYGLELCWLDRFVHKEKNLTDYCVQLTTSRTHPDEPKEYGGNFFIAEYGILMPRAANQGTVWMGKHYHGTTLILVEPVDKNPDFKQVAIVFILSKGLKGEVEREERNGVIGARNVDEDLLERDDFEVRKSVV